MKRFVVFIVLFSLLTLSAAWPANAASIKNSKHNLSYEVIVSTGTGSIKSDTTGIGGTSEICVFCHTPHSGNTAAPLWNKSISVQSYVTYTSDVLAGLTYPGAEDPNTHIKTKICLSCHDGTIALGSLVNLPYGASNQIPMQGTTGADVQYGMPKTAAGYIGLNLSDDHPVAIKYDSGPDSELKASPSKVRLYSITGSNYVECTSCHEPHDNQWGNFLVDTNDGSGLCMQCHFNKTGFSNSIHNLDGTGYNPPNGRTDPPTTLGTTVGGVKCMNCHFPHKAGVTTAAPETPNPASGKYLLSFQEEASCFNTGNDRWNTPGSNTTCHGSGAGAVSRNIETTENNPNRRHYTGDATRVGKHKATEGQQQGWLGTGNPNWHVECADCHNPHTASTTNHVPPANAVASLTSPLYGAGGVNVSIYPAWTGGSGSYNYIEPIGVVGTASFGVDKEYKICFKCHSDFAWGIGAAPVSSGGYNMTNQALEFGGNSASYHPVVSPTGRTVGTLKIPWIAAQGAQTMYCSDCHTKESGNRPLGPHGSANSFILVNPFNDTPSILNGGVEQSAGDLCFVCHDAAKYLTPSLTESGGSEFRESTGIQQNLHASHASRATTVSGAYGYKCVNCHARVPHGYTRRAMIVYTTDPAPYNNGARLISATFNSGGYLRTNCSTVAGCH